MTINHSATLPGWSSGYFSINPLGKMEVHLPQDETGVCLQSIVEAALRADLNLPLLIRFPDILRDRVRQLYEAFESVRKDRGYHGHYQLIYPIKVNQQQSVLKALLSTPGNAPGLEAGSKAELLAVMGMLSGQRSTIVCNGHKDSAYVRAALIACQMGHRVFLVMEKRSELPIILREAANMGIKPSIGIRIRLMSQGRGLWENTGGYQSKFGLQAEQVLEVVDYLKQQNALEYLQLMHCHLGSQIANIEDIRHCMQEVARYYVALRTLEVPVHTLDVGGGLAVDYEGTGSGKGFSMNYSIRDYATQIMQPLQEICAETQVPEPDLMTESGRALTAHHAVLICNIAEMEVIHEVPRSFGAEARDPEIIQDMIAVFSDRENVSAETSWHAASQHLVKAHSLFIKGLITLQQKARVEEIFHIFCLALQKKLNPEIAAEEKLLLKIHERLAAKVFCNLSFFQAIPDTWALKQIFPVLPLTRLDSSDNQHGVLADLTCDSDGSIKQYVGQKSPVSTLQLPGGSSPFLLAFFMVGAYQEVLGNLHNLFGKTDVAEVVLSHGHFEIRHTVNGDSIAEILEQMHYDPDELVKSCANQLSTTTLPLAIIQNYLREIRRMLGQPNYLEISEEEK